MTTPGTPERPLGFGSGKHDDVVRQRRIDREEREARAEAESRDTFRRVSANALLGVGALLLAIGVWFLLVRPSQGEVEGLAIANLHRLHLGQTASIVGAIFITGGLLIKTR